MEGDIYSDTFKLAGWGRGGGLQMAALIRERQTRFKLEEIGVKGREVRLEEMQGIRLRGPQGGEDPAATLLEGVRGVLHLRQKPGGLNVMGYIDAAVSMKCVRCLEAFRIPVRADIDLSFMAGNHAPLEEDVELSGDDLNIGFLVNDEIDLVEVVEEQLWLNLPMKPLCDEGCRGLCSVCGENLNMGECSCDREAMDSGFAVLEKLRARLPQGRK